MRTQEAIEAICTAKNYRSSRVSCARFTLKQYCSESELIYLIERESGLSVSKGFYSKKALVEILALVCEINNLGV